MAFIQLVPCSVDFYAGVYGWLFRSVQMKFYNPFRWHIVEIEGKYFVRKFSFFRFVYVSFDLCTYDYIKYVFGDAAHDTEQAARNTLNRLTMKARYIG